MSDLSLAVHTAPSWDFDAAFKGVRTAYNTSAIGVEDVFTQSYDLIDQSLATDTVEGFSNVFKVVSYLEKNFDDTKHFSTESLSQKMDQFLDAAYSKVAKMIYTAGEMPLYQPVTDNPYEPIESMFHLMKDAFYCKDHMVDPIMKCGFNKVGYDEEFKINIEELERLEKSYHKKSKTYDRTHRTSEITDNDKIKVMPLPRAHQMVG